MKLSIITTCLNADSTIRFTLDSILSQSYQNIEHIIVDGGSTDETKKILKKYPHTQKKIFTLKNSSIYQAINFGIKKSTGSFVCVLNADDIFNSNKTVESVVKIIKKKKYDMYFGDVVFIKNNEFLKPVRFYSSKDYKTEMIKKCLMPPHTASFIKREVYEKICLYNENFKIAADFNFFLETLIHFKLKFFIINKIITRMRLGGVSTKNLLSYFYNSYEIYKSFKINKIPLSYFDLLFRVFFKLKELLNLNINKLNKNFELPKINFEKNYFYSRQIKIVKNLNYIINKNFVLSAMNLAFLGSYAQKNVTIYKDLYHWPDGVFASYNYNIKKIPGRNLLKKIKLTKKILKIIVIGNLTIKSKNYLLSKFALPIKHIELPYGNIKKIIKAIKKTNIKNCLVFITLPTPKQEIIAEHLIKKNKFYKIICIGGSIALCSGEESPVPKLLYKFEFLWRLKYETKRRIKRLIITFCYYLKEKYFGNKFKQNYVLNISTNDK